MVRRLLLLVGLVIAGTLVLAACGGDDDDAGAEPAEVAAEEAAPAPAPAPAPEPEAAPAEPPAEAAGAAEAGTITTVAGTGEVDYSGDGGPAIEAGMSPQYLVFDAAGDLFFSDPAAERVVRIDSAGIITTIAGNGESGEYAGDGGPATEATLAGPLGLAIAPDGSLYIGASSSSRVFRIDLDGTITTVAGTGEQGDGEASGPATEIPLNSPFILAVDAAGNLFIAEGGLPRIRKVDADGVMTTFAGTGEPGYSGDGGPATEAQIGANILGIAADSDGNVYFSENQGRRVRKVDTEGTITTVAGNGESGEYAGDGGPATEATLAGPTGLAVAADGSLYLVDRGNNRVRRIDPDGIIDTIAGSATAAGYSGDGGPASEAELAGPEAIAFDADGNLYIVDFGNHRIRKVTP